MLKSLTHQYKAVFIGLLLFIFSVPVVAYVGPGAGLTLIGSLLGLIVAVLFVLVGIVLWPLRILWRRFFAKNRLDDDAAVNKTEEESH